MRRARKISAMTRRQKIGNAALAGCLLTMEHTLPEARGVAAVDDGRPAP